MSNILPLTIDFDSPRPFGVVKLSFVNLILERTVEHSNKDRLSLIIITVICLINKLMSY